jgi:protein gp37
MQETGIIWTEAVWNPLSGCQKISAGCKYCYAETLAEKYRGTPAFRNGFDLTLRPHKLNEPLKLKKPTLIFMNSMSDLFWDQVPNEYRHKVIDVIEATPQHEYQVLTKRPELMAKFSKERKLPNNFWAGTSIEHDKTRAERLFWLNQVDASLHFISAEPIIGAIHFEANDLDNVDWVITGGESGNHLWQGHICEERGLVLYNRTAKKWEVREDRADWIREIRDFCIDRNVKFFHKQWGGNYPEAAGRLLDGRTWTEFPRLPGEKSHIDNSYLKLIESKIGNHYGTSEF